VGVPVGALVRGDAGAKVELVVGIAGPPRSEALQEGERVPQEPGFVLVHDDAGGRVPALDVHPAGLERRGLDEGLDARRQVDHLDGLAGPDRQPAHRHAELDLGRARREPRPPLARSAQSPSLHGVLLRPAAAPGLSRQSSAVKRPET
jgi:hypothetical protein